MGGAEGGKKTSELSAPAPDLSSLVAPSTPVTQGYGNAFHATEPWRLATAHGEYSAASNRDACQNNTGRH